MSSLAWAHVVCSSCGRGYVCTPSDDYYNATCSTDGVCFDCLTADVPNSRVVIAQRRGDDVDVLDHGEDA